MARPEPRVAYLADVRHDAGEVTLRLVAGQALEGRVTNVPRGRRARVTLRAGALEREARTDRDGRFVLPNVPPGRWPLRARVYDGSVLLLEGAAEAGPGASVELVLAPP